MSEQEHRVITITDEQLKNLADESARRAAEETVELMRTNLMRAIGESVVQKAGYLLAVGLVAAWWYLQGKGIVGNVSGGR